MADAKAPLLWGGHRVLATWTHPHFSHLLTHPYPTLLHCMYTPLPTLSTLYNDLSLHCIQSYIHTSWSVYIALYFHCGVYVCTFHTHICIETSNFSCVYACVCSRHVSQWRRLVSVVPVRSPVCSCSHPETALLPLVY